MGSQVDQTKKPWEFSEIDGGLFFPAAEVEESVIKE